MELAYTKETDKNFDDVVAALETKSQENTFRVLHVHNVQTTLAEKGFEIHPLKIIEVCNAKFAHTALGKSLNVALFMPCKFTVAETAGKTVVSLGLPSMIAQIMPEAGLESLAAQVEDTLKKVMDESI